MEVLFGENFDLKLIGDSLDNFKYERSFSRTELSDVHIAKADGKILVNDGFLPYKKGQIIMVIRAWDDNLASWHCRPIVFNNDTVAEALTEFENTVKNETV